MIWLLLLFTSAVGYSLREVWLDRTLYPTWPQRGGYALWNFCWFFLWWGGLLGFMVLLAGFHLLQGLDRLQQKKPQETATEYDLAALRVEIQSASNRETRLEDE